MNLEPLTIQITLKEPLFVSVYCVQNSVIAHLRDVCARKMKYLHEYVYMHTTNLLTGKSEILAKKKSLHALKQFNNEKKKPSGLHESVNNNKNSS